MSELVAGDGLLRVDHLDPAEVRRVRQTVSCRDSDDLPKVPLAGQVIEHEGSRVQVMHNGVLVEEGGYFGDWMTEIIRALRGHHEPQEELVFAAMVRAVAGSAAKDATSPVMIEFGAFWATTRSGSVTTCPGGARSASSRTPPTWASGSATSSSTGSVTGSTSSPGWSVRSPGRRSPSSPRATVWSGRCRSTTWPR